MLANKPCENANLMLLDWTLSESLMIKFLYIMQNSFIWQTLLPKMINKWWQIQSKHRRSNQWHCTTGLPLDDQEQVQEIENNSFFFN